MLKVKNQEIDLGNLRFGNPHNFFFEVSNDSKDTIYITKIILGCNACTRASMEKSSVAPGETVKLNVTFTPGSTGINNKSITIVYSGTSQIKLKFKAFVNK